MPYHVAEDAVSFTSFEHFRVLELVSGLKGSDFLIMGDERTKEVVIV